MEKIIQYYKITNIKPEYHVLHKPLYKPSRKRIILNGKELELHYLAEFGTYVNEEIFEKNKIKEHNENKIRGHGENSSKMTVILL